KIFIYNVFGAMLIVYLCGVTYLSFVSNLPWGPTALSALTFIPGDLIKVVLQVLSQSKSTKCILLLELINMQPHNNLGIGALLDHYVKIHPNKIAIYYEDTSITYKSFKQSILNYQNHFKKMLDPNQ